MVEKQGSPIQISTKLPDPGKVEIPQSPGEVPATSPSPSPPQPTPKASKASLMSPVGVVSVIFFTFLIAGMIVYLGFFNPSNYGSEGGRDVNRDMHMPPALSPARDLTGSWSGTFSIKENADYSAWVSTGKATLTLKQTGTKVTGTFTLDGITTSKIKELNQRSSTSTNSFTGTVGGTRIEFTDGFIRFSGTFTTDILIINMESCSLNNYCVNPANKDSRYVSEPGIKGVINLARDW